MYSARDRNMSAQNRANRTALFGDRSQREARNQMLVQESEQLLQQQNDKEIDSLRGKVSILKDISISIDNEVAAQNKMLDQMSTDMDGAKGMLTGTMKKLQKMIDTGGNKHMLYLVFFVVFVFFLIWFLLGGSSDDTTAEDAQT